MSNSRTDQDEDRDIEKGIAMDIDHSEETFASILRLPRDMFPHENFGPYKAGIEFPSLVSTICQNTPRGHGDLLDQLKRAAASITLNIAEGSGRTSRPEMKRFYSIARGAAMECVAFLDVLFHLKLVTPPIRDHARSLLHSIVAILTSIYRKSSVQLTDK